LFSEKTLFYCVFPVLLLPDVSLLAPRKKRWTRREGEIFRTGLGDLAVILLAALSFCAGDNFGGGGRGGDFCEIFSAGGFESTVTLAMGFVDFVVVVMVAVPDVDDWRASGLTGMGEAPAEFFRLDELVGILCD
jgi:hypothetical protein